VKRLSFVLAVAAAAPILSLLGLYAIRFLALDSCLDSGGVFDYIALSCRTDVQSLPVGPLVRPPLAQALLAAGAGLAVLSVLFGRRARRGH
jgi:hypothetical protein